MGRTLNGATIRILTSAGPGEGRGHFSRALALAEAAEEIGVPCRISLARGRPSDGEATRAAAAGAVLGVDAADAARRSGERVIVDLPDPNEAGPAILARATVFDDSERLRHPVRIVVQPSQPGWMARGEATAEVVLAGYALAPLGRAVRAARAARDPGAGGDGVIACFGGSDPYDISARLGPAIQAAVPGATVVVGPDYRGALRPDGRSVIGDPADLVDRLVRARLAVIGAGTMKFEAAALGVPAVLVGAADDQGPVGPAFATTGAAVWAGDGRLVDPAAVGQLVRALLDDPAGLAELARRGREVVPGDGARRIVLQSIDQGSQEENAR